ncbi:hypothetical protein [Pseudomonas hunanensis]|uniref:hypothetical protein n=1 Tax=Pseudomonas hunanensis TaxID=1247546 RepID=UPI00380C137F
MNTITPPFTPPYTAWNTPRLDNITRLINYCKTLQSVADFGRQQWAVQALVQIGQPIPSSATALETLSEHLAALQELLLDHLIRHSAEAHPLLSAEQNRLILAKMVAAFEPGTGSLFDAALGAWAKEEDIETRLKSPATLLADAEQAPCMRELVARVQHALHWMNSDSSPPQSPILWLKLLRHCLALALAPDNALQGFDFTNPEHAGMTVDEIFIALDEHLLTRNALTNRDHLPLARYLLTPRFPAAFQVSDLPGEMVYRSSAWWVHFQTAVNLSEMLSPGDARRKSSTEIHLLPNTLKKRHPDGFATLYESATTQPVLEWAMANRKIGQSPTELFSDAEVKQAYADFNAEQARMLDANSKIATPMPVRFEMAKAQLLKHGIDPEMRCFEILFAADSKPRSWNISFARPAWEVYTSGHFATWSPPGRPDALQALNLPDITAEFERDFDVWFANFASGLKWQLAELLGQLPASEKRFIENAVLDLFQVRIASGKTVSYDEYQGVSHLIGRAGLLLQASKSGKQRCYEVFPMAGLIVRRGEFVFSKGGRRTYPEPHFGNPLGSNSHSGWHNGTREALDWNAYEGTALPQSGKRSSVIIQPIAHIQGKDDSFEQLIARFALVACETHFLAMKAKLRQQAKGMTDSEKPHWTYTWLKAVTPLWKPVEDMIQGIEEDRPGLVRKGIGTGLMDLIHIGTPLRQVGVLSRIALRQLQAVAFRALIKLGSAGVRAACISVRLSVPALALTVNRLAIVASRNVAGTVVPLFGLVHLSISAGPKILRLTASGFRQLRKARKTISKTMNEVHYSAGMTSVKPTLAGSYPGKQSGYVLSRVDQQARVVTQWANPGQDAGASRYLVDLHTARPYGPRLMQIDDHGTLSHRPPDTLPITTSGTVEQFTDELPGLTKDWVRWGDDLFLESKDLLYKRVDMKLVRLDRVSLRSQKPLASSVSCRSVRSGRGEVICVVGNSAFPEAHTTGRDVVPWFNDRKVVTRNRKYVYNNERCNVAGSEPIHNHSPLRYERYNATINVEVLGGNEVFKAIRIDGGICQGFRESHMLSAVLAPRRSDGVTFLVTRADPGVFYSGPWKPGDGSVQLTKFRPRSLTRATPNQNDSLALIYTGSYDAHLKLIPLDEQQMNARFAEVATHFNNYQGLPEYDVFIGGHFDMGTTPQQAALFCHFTQLRLNQAMRAAIGAWSTVTLDSNAADREDIATQINRILKPTTPYDIDSITRSSDVSRMMTHPNLPDKNLAYLKLDFNTTPATSDVYFSVSGLPRPVFTTALTRFINGANQPGFAAWRRQNRVAISPDGTRYIDAQPTYEQATNRRTPFSVPDISTPRHFIDSSHNPRTLDSEINILEKLYSAGIDFGTISSATLYTKLPVCPSCTQLLFEFHNRIGSGKLRVFEGLPR